MGGNEMDFKVYPNMGFRGPSKIVGLWQKIYFF